MCCLALLILLSANAVRSQDEKAVLIDEFGNAPCDELLARADNFMQAVNRDPNSRGVAVIYPKKGEFRSADHRRRWILARFEYNGIEDRVAFIKGPEQNEFKAEFWDIPAGAEEPNFQGERWVDPTLDLSKPFMFGYEDEIGECPMFVPRKFAGLINGNPGSRAHIVLRGGRMGDVGPTDFARQWVDTLTKQFNIPRNRIKVFYAKGDNNFTFAEFWFVPAKRR